MEALAFLHLAQDYENPEYRGLCTSSFSLLNGLSSTGAIALLSALSATWVAGLAQASSAEVYSTDVSVYDYGPVMVRPNGDQPFSEQGCGCAINPCGNYRPIRPLPIPNPDYRPVRPSGDVFLRRGDVGSDVRYIQDLLRSAGYFDASSTGFYATLTQRGVESFQRDRGLGIDGIVGPETLAALENRV